MLNLLLLWCHTILVNNDHSQLQFIARTGRLDKTELWINNRTLFPRERGNEGEQTKMTSLLMIFFCMETSIQLPASVYNYKVMKLFSWHLDVPVFDVLIKKIHFSQFPNSSHISCCVKLMMVLILQIGKQITPYRYYHISLQIPEDSIFGQYHFLQCRFPQRFGYLYHSYNLFAFQFHIVTILYPVSRKRWTLNSINGEDNATVIKVTIYKPMILGLHINFRLEFI